MWNPESFKRIDAELLRLETLSDGYIFDSSTMPWRHRRPALCIWLESTLESRVIKSIVSHRGRGVFGRQEYEERIRRKDESTIKLYRELYGIKRQSDPAYFDLIIDISSLIAEPTLSESLKSISFAHSLIRPAVAWYLTAEPSFRAQFEAAIAKCPPGMVLRNCVKPVRELANAAKGGFNG